MLTHIHHLTFLVRDLNAACRRYAESFGVGPFVRERLAARGVDTARLRIGDTWLVLAQPIDPDGVPGRHLAEHGEGLFVLSFAVDDLDRSIGELQHTAMPARPETRRRGLADWEVVDLAGEASAGYGVQLARDGGGRLPGMKTRG